MLPQNKGKHKQKKALPSTELGVVPEIIVTGILRVVNHHVVDIKNYAMSIKNVISKKLSSAVKKKSDNKNSNTTQNVKKIISIDEPREYRKKPENPTMA